MKILVFGHSGAPLIAFPSGGGTFFDMENNLMIEALEPLINAGKIKIFCTESLDKETWLNDEIDSHWQAIRYNDYQEYFTKDLVPGIRKHCNTDDIKIGLIGCSLGALHSANFALKYPDLFNYALCMSGRYDLGSITSSTESQEVYFNNPMAYVPHLHGASLDHVHQTHIALVCGQGAYEEKCLDETHRLADLLVAKGVSHERDIWGQDIKHDWCSWRQQVAHHLGKTFG